MITLFRLLSHLPLRALHALGAVLGWLAFAGSPTYRRRFRDNLREARLPAAAARGAVAEAGRMAAELPRLWMGRAVPITWDGAELVEEALAGGHGLVFLTPHMGSFEITAQAYAAQFAADHGAVTVLYRPARKAWLRPLLEQARHRPGLETAPTTLAGVKQMIKALREGRAVGLLPDQVPPQGQGVWAPFFGREAYTMTLSFRLVRQSGAALLLIWGERLPRGRGYVIHVRRPSALLQDADPAAAAAQVNAEMEQLIREQPSQYLWGYARYKAPAAGSRA